MDIKAFEDLEVFQRAYKVSLEVHRKSLEMPQIEQYALADQMRRASKSICVNLAEGFAKLRLLGCRIQALHSNEHWIGRRDAGMDPLLP